MHPVCIEHAGKMHFWCGFGDFIARCKQLTGVVICELSMGGRGWSVFAKPRGFLRKASVPQFSLDHAQVFMRKDGDRIPGPGWAMIVANVRGTCPKPASSMHRTCGKNALLARFWELHCTLQTANRRGDLRVEHGWPGLERLREPPGLPSQSLSPAPATQPAILAWTMHKSSCEMTAIVF